MRKPLTIMLDAFCENFLMGGLFGKQRIPGAPRQLIDGRNAVEYLVGLESLALTGNKAATIVETTRAKCATRFVADHQEHVETVPSSIDHRETVGHA